MYGFSPTVFLNNNLIEGCIMYSTDDKVPIHAAQFSNNLGNDLTINMAMRV